MTHRRRASAWASPSNKPSRRILHGPTRRDDKCSCIESVRQDLRSIPPEVRNEIAAGIFPSTAAEQPPRLKATATRSRYCQIDLSVQAFNFSRMTTALSDQSSIPRLVEAGKINELNTTCPSLTNTS